MRARSIKPGMFKNETLGSADPLYSIIFAGLWCLADREGRLEDRPLRIHVEINPYRNSASTVQALDWLVTNRFVIRYVHGDGKYLAVCNFKQHQQPHIKESTSKLPAPPNQEVVRAPGEHGASTEVAALTPSSLTPDSGLLTPTSGSKTAAAPLARKRRKVSRETDPDWLLDFKLAYPERAGDPGWRKAVSAAYERIREGHFPEEFIAGATRYAAFCEVTGKVATQYVQQAATFLGTGKPFLLPWTAPAKAENAYDRIMRLNGGNDESKVIEHENEFPALEHTR